MYPTLRFFIFLLLSTALFASQNSSDKKINIVADSQEFNYRTGVNIYEGNVKIDQGTTHLSADRVTTKNNQQHKILEAIAYGTKQLAKYTTIPKPGDPVLEAQAKIIKFYPPSETIVLEGDVIVTQGENSFHGPTIIYNMKDQTVTAPASKTGRATIIIDPDKLKS